MVSFSNVIKVGRLSAQKLFFLSFALTYLLIVQYLRVTDASDPSSLFFNATRAYERRYSAVRIREANGYMKQMSTESALPHAVKDPSICLGVLTVQRTDADYFTTLMGSLLHGLSDSERRDIDVTPFFADTNPYVHQAFNESWLHKFADRIVTYEELPPRDKAHLHALESPDGHREKGLYDYSYMLEQCLNTESPYVLVLEDDVLAVEGWYQRTKSAIADLEERPEYDRSIYLRLFYNTRLQGWNSESWPSYLFWSTVFELVLAGMLVALRYSCTTASRFLTRRTTGVILALYAPACVALYFSAGRLTVQPYPHGIHRMNEYGCCSQAFVFPRQQISPLLRFLRERETGFRDSLIEEYADNRGLVRWALTPSVFQHIGTRSSKWKGPGSDIVDENGRLSTERIWNYQFEYGDAGVLHVTHGM